MCRCWVLSLVCYSNDNSLDKSDVENLSGDVDIAAGIAFKSRTFFVVGPLEQGNHFIKVILNYPAAVGFSAELLRVVDALQVADSARFDNKLI
jgi:alkyl hydroperoxide reductase subunit AhpC